MLKLSLKAKTLTVLFLLVSLLLIKACSLYEAMSPNPIEFWQASNEHSQQQIDHQLWQDVLTNNLVEQPQGRMFNYRDVSPQDQQKLTDYIDQLQAIEPRTHHKDQQLAYWVNLYNAITVNLILHHYPLASIKDIGNGFTGPWNVTQVTISGQPLTLNQIEHKILRAIWQDKRIHYVINCASIGCPDLALKAFNASEIEQQLNDAATRFINQLKAVEFINQTLVLSSIYHWFANDFGHNQAELLDHLSHYARPSLKQQLKAHHGKIEYSYNWQLNQPITEPL